MTNPAADPMLPQYLTVLGDLRACTTPECATVVAALEQAIKWKYADTPWAVLGPELAWTFSSQTEAFAWLQSNGWLLANGEPWPGLVIVDLMK